MGERKLVNETYMFIGSMDFASSRRESLLANNHPYFVKHNKEEVRSIMHV